MDVSARLGSVSVGGNGMWFLCQGNEAAPHFTLCESICDVTCALWLQQGRHHPKTPLATQWPKAMALCTSHLQTEDDAADKSAIREHSVSDNCVEHEVSDSSDVTFRNIQFVKREGHGAR